jgi:hypothetical protein
MKYIGWNRQLCVVHVYSIYIICMHLPFLEANFAKLVLLSHPYAVSACPLLALIALVTQPAATRIRPTAGTNLLGLSVPHLQLSSIRHSYLQSTKIVGTNSSPCGTYIATK